MTPLSTCDLQALSPVGRLRPQLQVVPPSDYMDLEGCENAWKLAIHEAQSRVLAMVAKAEPLESLLNVLVREIEALSEARCSILLLNEAGTHLMLGAAPSFPDSYQAFLRQGLPVSPDTGTCGPAVSSKEPVGCVDVRTSPLWDSCRDFPLSYGFYAYWSKPILDSSGNALGSFAMVYTQPTTPSESDCQLVEMAAYLASIAIERQKADEQLRLLNAQLEVQVQQRTAQLQRSLKHEASLNRITDKVRVNLDEASILQAVVQELAQVLGCLVCEAGIYDHQTLTRTVKYEYSVLPSRVGWTDDMESLAQDPFCGLNAPFPSHSHTTAITCPIEDEQRAIGDIWLFKPCHESFDEQEIALVRQVASQCAIALRQARLYAASQRQVNELEQLNRLKDDFLSTVSHELRTPIANIKMATKMLQTNPPETQRQRYLAILEQECHRESDLINDLLDLQRLEASSAQLLKEDWVNLPETLPVLVEPFSARAQQRQQELIVRLQPGLPPLLTHRHSLERVLSELLNNACKYTPAQGHIELTIGSTHDRVWLILRNEAPIPAAQIGLIFQKFYRIPNADPWRQGGTGLGLALVKTLIERLGGSISAESCNQWTTFRVDL